MPGSENVLSVRIAPPSSSPRSRPKIVRIGVSAERSPCLTTTVRSGRPLARAVRMKSSPIVSSMPARVSRAYAAAYRNASVIHGSSRSYAHSSGFSSNGV